MKKMVQYNNTRKLEEGSTYIYKDKSVCVWEGVCVCVGGWERERERERERETIVPKTLADNNNWKREGESEVKS